MIIQLYGINKTSIECYYQDNVKYISTELVTRLVEQHLPSHLIHSYFICLDIGGDLYKSARVESPTPVRTPWIRPARAAHDTDSEYLARSLWSLQKWVNEL